MSITLLQLQQVPCAYLKREEISILKTIELNGEAVHVDMGNGSSGASARVLLPYSDSDSDQE